MAAVTIGGAKQLFVDDFLIDRRDGVNLVMNRPHAQPAMLLGTDKAWQEGPQDFIWAASSVLAVNGKVRLWYQVNVLEPRPQPVGFVAVDKFVAYAESADGVHFDKPDLNLCPRDGAKPNNVVIPDTEGCSVWIDPKAQPQRRYRSIHCDAQAYKPVFHSSPDGLRWTRTHEAAIGDCDSQASIFWDRTIGRYVMYTRQWVPKPPPPETASRAHRRLESDDLVHWDRSTIILQADERDLATYDASDDMPPVDYYGACVFRYPDPTGPYLMLAQPFWHWYPRGGPTRPGPCGYDVRMLVSRDGANFERLRDRPVFLGPGPMGGWCSRQVWVLPQPLVMNDEIWIYFFGANFDHEGILDPWSQGRHRTGIGRAVTRLDGFVSADAGFDGGELTTKPIVFDGERLELNIDTSIGGFAQVEILDEQGQPIAGFAKDECEVICGNSVRWPVRWNGPRQIAELAGRPVRLRFVMRDSRLFAFQFVNDRGSRG